MQYGYYICDVFSSEPFGGNQTTVLYDARGLSAEGMLKITQEFRFTECVFAFPPTNDEADIQLRIFNPVAEMNFAGHPTLGAVSAMVYGGHLTPPRVVVQERVGLLSVTVDRSGSEVRGMMETTAKLNYPERIPDLTGMANVLSLKTEDVKDGFFAGAGLDFCFVQLGTKEAVDRAVVDVFAWEKHLKDEWASNIFFFHGELKNGAEIYARVSAPALGAMEDPATGSAAVALVGAASVRAGMADGSFDISIRQGIKVGRPSFMRANSKVIDGKAVKLSVGGATHVVASGQIEVGDKWLDK